MKKFLLFMSTMALTCLSTPLKSQNYQWVDVTNTYLSNPSFVNNSSAGWTISFNGWSQNVNYEEMEFYNSTSFDISQTLTVPNGNYRVSVQAFYRMADYNTAYRRYSRGTEAITAYLYANSDQVALASLFSYSFPSYTTNTVQPSNSNLWYCDGMLSAASAFENDAYWNEIETTVTDKSLKLGLTQTSSYSSNWTIFDNFKLERYMQLVNVTGITFPSSTVSLVFGQNCQLSPTIAPSNATITALEWTSSNENVAVVDDNGYVTTVGTGTCVITATATDGSNVSASCTIRSTINSPTTSNVIINEIMPANIDMFMSSSTNFDGWIELYNPTSKPVSLGGCYLGKKATNLKKWLMPDDIGVVPANGYKVIWFDHSELEHTQTTYKLDAAGDTVFLSDRNGNLIVSQAYPAVFRRASYARTTDGGDTWKFTAAPTPGESNAGVAYCTSQLTAPVVDQGSQFFTGSMAINVTIPTGYVLRYTTDGTTPVATSTRSTTGSFNISETTVFRFRFFRSGYIPSDVVSRSYILNSDNTEFTIPVISIVTDPDYLYDDSIGIYVKGTNGRPGNGQSTECNWNMGWDRPVNFSYIVPGNEMAFNQDVFMSIAGGWSRSWTPRPFKLKGNQLFGSESLDYPFFESKPYIKNRTLQIRNGGNDTSCMFKDPSLQQIMATSGIDLDLQAYQPVLHYFNGEFMGFINMREPNNKHFVDANYGWDSDEIDQFEIGPDSGYFQSCGTKDAFLRLYNLTANAADDATYAEIQTLLDVDEYINYMAAQMYLGNWDWPQNNVKGYRNEVDGKFRFVIYDLDGALSTTTPFTTFEGKQNYTFDTLYPSGDRITEEIEFVTIFLNLLDNETFRKQFIDTYCLMGGSVFEPTRVSEIINSMVEKVTAMMALSGKSPSSTANTVNNTLAGRNSSMIYTLKQYSRMNLSSTNAQAVTLDTDTEGARLFVNGIHVPTDYFNGNLFSPVTIKAEAPAGYKFLGWRGDGSTTANSANSVALFNEGSAWKYYDGGSLDNTTWYDEDYDDNSWNSGLAPLGYSTNGVHTLTTTLSYGSDASNKYSTYYFRKDVNLSDAPSSDDSFTLSFTVDDGAIVYVNGKEVGRYNMPSGTVAFSTFASSYAPSNPDLSSIVIPSTYFKQGANVIAVEIHNCDASSTDVLWDASLAQSTGDYYSTSAEIEMPASGALNITACFTEMTDIDKALAKTNPVMINEVSASNGRYVNEYFKRNDWVELYNTTGEDIDVEGMYLSDNLEKPTKYQITKGTTSANTVIPAHGYLIIWCDKLATSEQLHATFKLNSAENYVMLTAADKSWCDTLKYAAHDENYTVGRYPDGGNKVYMMNIQTIGETNRLALNNSTLYSEYVAPKYLRGDVNGDGSVNVTDIISLLGYNLSEPVTINKINSDVDLDSSVKVSDLIELINLILR